MADFRPEPSKETRELLSFCHKNYSVVEEIVKLVKENETYSENIEKEIKLSNVSQEGNLLDNCRKILTGKYLINLEKLIEKSNLAVEFDIKGLYLPIIYVSELSTEQLDLDKGVYRSELTNYNYSVFSMFNKNIELLTTACNISFDRWGNWGLDNFKIIDYNLIVERTYSVIGRIKEKMQEFRKENDSTYHYYKLSLRFLRAVLKKAKEIDNETFNSVLKDKKYRIRLIETRKKAFCLK